MGEKKSKKVPAETVPKLQILEKDFWNIQGRYKIVEDRPKKKRGAK